MAEKKYYWLKLQKDFFKRHDIRIVENMPNGKDYILFYLKLLVESVSHYGHLRFSDTIPYTPEMLATITNTNIDIVRSAIELFKGLHMIEILDNDTVFMTEIEKMIGAETEWAEKKRLYREGCKLLETGEGQKGTMSDKSKSKNQKKSKKQSNNSDTANAEFFEQFWTAYPKKVAKADALKAWNKIKLDQELFQKIIQSLSIQKQSEKWQEKNGKYIPNPATWLNGKRWEDEVKVGGEHSTNSAKNGNRYDQDEYSNFFS